MEDLVKVIHDEDEAKRVKVTAEATQRRGALSKRKLAPFSDNEPGQCFLPVALQPTGPTAGLKFTTVSKFVGKPTKPAHVDPLAKERRLCLLELTKQSFPDGKVPDPFS